MPTSGFDTYYGDNPWSGLSANQRSWYVPDLLDVFRAKAVYNQFVPMKVDLAAQRTGLMVFNLVYDMEPNTDAIGLRDLWLPSAYTDSASLTIGMEHYGDKVSLHKYDEMITYWRQNGRVGLRPIIRDKIAISMTETMDILARNAFLTAPYAIYAASGTGTLFSGIAATDVFDADTIKDIWLGLSYRDVPLAQNPSGGTNGALVAIASPGVIYDIQNNKSEWLDILKYADISRALRYEVGTIYNARFLSTTRNTLWNCGAIVTQKTITSAVQPGAGAARTVDTVYTVGQSDATTYIQLNSVAGLEVNDVVTIHTVRTNDFGVTNGVDYRSGKNTVRRIVSIDTVNNRISLDKPVMKEYTTDLGGGVYGYVTKGRHIHATIFLAGPNGVVAGVAQPPEFHEAPVVDDLMAMYRFSWDSYMKYQVFRPEVFEVVFSAGSVRMKGDVVNQ